MSRLSPKVVVSATFVAGNLMAALDSTIVNVALPTLGRDFHAGTNGVDWIVIGYMLSLALWIPASGWVGDRFGTKRTFLFALAAFTAASALCGQAHSLTELVAFRVLQGVGGGMLTPVGLAMLMRAFPPHERATASRILVVATVVGPASGPILGGLFVDKITWRWIFYVNVPIGLAAFLFGLLFLQEHREEKAGAFDLPGFLLAGLGLALLLYSFNEGPTQGWTSPEVLISGILGAAGVAALVWVELHRREPMLKLQLFCERLFRSTNVAALFAFASFLGLLFLMSLYLQEARGLSALETGLTTFVEAVGIASASQIVGRVYPRIGPRRLMVGGMVGVSIVLALFALMDLNTNLWLVRGGMFLAGAAMAGMFISLQTATYARITPEDTGRASAIFSAQRQVAAALGVAIMATVLAAQLAHVGGPAAPPQVQLSAFRITFAVDAALAVLAALVSLSVRDRDAANTMAVSTAADDMAERAA
ncbi:MAG TPA: MDR family MFS transporter [Chloroflexota bacterium]|nr:MDR family MFS transporter [Chloroflexota bacterium]